MPEILVRLAFEEYDGPYNVLNPCTKDMYWIRGIDVVPVLIHKNELNSKEDEYQQMLKEIQ